MTVPIWFRSIGRPASTGADAGTCGLSPAPGTRRQAMARLSDQEKLVETLRRQHLKLDEQVQELESRRWLSTTDEAQVRRLKRLKLATKDQLHAVATQRR